MEKGSNRKKMPLSALRFKEVRLNYFHEDSVRKGRRKDNGQEAFAEYLGITPQTVRGYENGSRPIPEKYLRKLSEDFHLRVEYLLGKDGFRTAAEKRGALAQKDLEENIKRPLKISRLIQQIIEEMGYSSFEDEVTETEFFTADFNIPAGYTPRDNIPHENIVETFADTYRFIRPNAYHAIRRESDGRAKYITDTRLNALYDDIESFIRYRIEREFR